METQSAGGVILNNQEVLLVSQHGKSWSLPKGHLDPGESLLAAAYREIHEETGITHLQYIQKLGSYKRYKIGKTNDTEDKSELKDMHFFLFKTAQRFTQSHDTDNPDVEWVPIEHVEKKLTHPKDKDFFTSIIPILHAYSCTLISIETTFPTQEEAKKICQELLNKKLAACCQIQPIESFYIWENKQESSQEFRCSIKSKQSLFHEINTFITEKHSYDCPQLTAHPIDATSPKYKEWALSLLQTQA